MLLTFVILFGLAVFSKRRHRRCPRGYTPRKRDIQSSLIFVNQGWSQCQVKSGRPIQTTYIFTQPGFCTPLSSTDCSCSCDLLSYQVFRTKTSIYLYWRDFLVIFAYPHYNCRTSFNIQHLVARITYS